MPFKTAEEKVLGAVPTEVPLTITATGDKGLDPTLTLSETLVRQGYSVAPHIPARMVSGPGELDEIVSRLESAGIDRLVVIGGDAEEPAGEFHQAVDLLKALQTRGHHLRDIGIGGTQKAMPSSQTRPSIKPFATKPPTPIVSSLRSASVRRRSSDGANASAPKVWSFQSSQACRAR